MSKRNSEPTITFTDQPNAVTIRIAGKAFDNLKEITAIFNKWDEGDNTPADIARRFLCAGDDWGCLDEKQPEPFNQTLPGMICDAFSKEPDMPKLERAFKAAGFSTSR